MLFGFGAGMNGACSFSTLARLAEGHSVMLLTLVGWGIGLVAVKTHWAVPREASVAAVPAWLVLPGIVWIVWELGCPLQRIWRQGRSIWTGALWPLSLVVFLVALANTGLLLLDRPWSFTSTAICTSGAADLTPCAHPGVLWLVLQLRIIAGLLMRDGGHGRIVNAARQFPPAPGPAAAVWRRLPDDGRCRDDPGGNDGLILFGIPSLSAHALPSWFGIVAGIWMALTIMRALGARVPTISCEGDICRTVPVTPPTAASPSDK